MSLLTIVANLKEPFHLSTQAVLRGGQGRGAGGLQDRVEGFGGCGFLAPFTTSGHACESGGYSMLELWLSFGGSAASAFQA